ncbi:MAG TPA: EamA family transporter [Rhodopila sp.]|uniref:DMT family transporter n=1 Tax=Rhodopila sp. TaxID=2480087 RepID=UPI002C39D54F|nr:EamA family transporter [Rhodopila sp.]HVY15040.1 EamA family transporter [Rhodopila sp.]
MPSITVPARRLIGTRAEGLALVLFTACSWGITWPTTKFMLTMLPPYSVRAVSGVIGCGLALGIAVLRGEKLWPPRDQWGRIILYAMLNFGLFIVLTVHAIALLRASEAVTITYTIPVWAVLLSWPLLGERPTALKLLALALALGGVALLVGADTAEARWDKAFPAGLALAAAICFGLGTVLATKRPLRLPPTVSVFWQALFGIAVVIAFAVPEHRDWDKVTGLGWFGLIYIAVVPLTLAYVAWFRALKLVSASTASTTVLISPMVGVIGSGFMLHETFGLRQIVALAMTLSGVALASRR